MKWPKNSATTKLVSVGESWVANKLTMKVKCTHISRNGSTIYMLFIIICHVPFFFWDVNVLYECWWANCKQQVVWKQPRFVHEIGCSKSNGTSREKTSNALFSSLSCSIVDFMFGIVCAVCVWCSDTRTIWWNFSGAYLVLFESRQLTHTQHGTCWQLQKKTTCTNDNSLPFSM